MISPSIWCSTVFQFSSKVSVFTINIITHNINNNTNTINLILLFLSPLFRALSIAQEIGVQSQVVSYQKLQKMVLDNLLILILTAFGMLDYWSGLVGVDINISRCLVFFASDRGLVALSDHLSSSPAEWERSAALVRGTWGQYVAVCSVSHSPLTHNTFATLSRIKCERYIFLKKCVHLSLLLIMFPHIYLYI